MSSFGYHSKFFVYAFTSGRENYLCLWIWTSYHRLQKSVMIPTIFISKQICFSSPNICRQNFTFLSRRFVVDAFTAFDCKATLCTIQQSRRFLFGYQTNVESGVFHVQVEQHALQSRSFDRSIYGNKIIECDRMEQRL